MGEGIRLGERDGGLDAGRENIRLVECDREVDCGEEVGEISGEKYTKHERRRTSERRRSRKAAVQRERNCLNETIGKDKCKKILL